jgi:hypothetical protein
MKIIPPLSSLVIPTLRTVLTVSGSTSTTSFRAPTMAYLYIPRMPTDYQNMEEDFVIGTKRSHPGDDEDDTEISGPSKAPRSSKK